MPDTRPLILAIALEAAPMGAVRLMRSSGQRSAYVATLVVDPVRDTAANSWTVPPQTAPWDSPAGVHFRR